ncbi:MAG TPA: HEAT repeat domain-containing protein [Sedimentisphaerales bacterium]|nr:HEAT repeat domain-containing protein [Sedimentisphaerales bacterium]
MKPLRNTFFSAVLCIFVLAHNIDAQEKESKGLKNGFDEVMEVIRTGNAYQRAETVPTLARIDDPRVVAALIDLLNDDDETVRAYAAQQLDLLADKRAAKALVKALGDSSSRVRTVAANGLTKIGDRSAVGALVKTVLENLPKVGEDYHGRDSMRAALRAIARLSTNSPPEIIVLLRPIATGETVDAKLWWFYEVVAQCLGEIGDKAAFDQLQRADEVLSSMRSDYKTWYAVRKAMSAIGPQAAPFNRPAADILYSFRTFKIDQDGIRQRWVFPLAELGNSAIGDIEWALKFTETQNESRSRKMVGIEALGEIGGPEAAKVLGGYIDGLFVDDVPEKQVSPGESARLGPGRRLCRQCDYPLRVALIALFKAQPDVDTAKEIVALLPLEKFEQTNVLYEIERATPQKVPAAAAVELYSLLVLPQPPEGIERFASWRAMEFLARIGGEQAGRVLSRVLLESSNAKLVELAADGLGKIKDYDAVPTLMEASKVRNIPAERVARAMGAINDKRAVPGLEYMAGRDNLSQADRLWIAAALARLGKDYQQNAAIVRSALPDSLEQAKWLNDPETIKAVAALSEQGKNPLEAAQTLEAVGTKESLEKALQILSSLIDPERPGDAKRLQTVASSAARLANKLASPKESYYADIATVSSEALRWFEMGQQASPRAEAISGFEAVGRLPALARKIWIVEATRRLDLAAKQQEPNWEFELNGSEIRAIKGIFAPELVPVLERIVKENQSTVSFHGKYQIAKFYNVRSRAARILTEETGQPHTFVDVDGRTHPGGWDPSQEK